MQKQNITALSIVAIIIGMFGLAFASVPLYNLFCKVTGYGGTVSEVQDKVIDNIGTRKMTILFNADLNPDLKLKFHAKQRKILTNPGKKNLAFYEVKNFSNKNIKAIATYNVTPLKAGEYFKKIDCFCFEEQIIKAGQKINLPVYFYIDAAMEDDPYMKEVNTITLSYSFFPVGK